MNNAAVSSATANRTSRKRASFEEGLRLRIGALITERDLLDEEVRQLRAAVHIYSELVRRLEVRDRQQVA